MTSSPQPMAEPPQLRFFITYASEDRPAAVALSNALTDRLGDDFAQVFLDTESLRPGFDFSQQIRDSLDKTDVLILVYTGRSKPSHSWTGLEVGYFLAVIKSSPYFAASGNDDDRYNRRRRIVSFYLDSPPPATSGIQGISFDISKSTLALTEDEYSRAIADIGTSTPVVAFFLEMEAEVDRLREAYGWKQKPRDLHKLVSCVQSMLGAVFSHLKNSIDIDVNPQKKIVVRLTGDLNREVVALPENAQVIPYGGAMEIFGLPSTEFSWSDFLSRAPDEFRATWKDVIETVITSSIPDRLDVDNSQILVTRNEGQIYRVILSRSVRYFNGTRDFHIYFVECLRRWDYGNPLTTLLIKGLGLACRFRFMFFEHRSDFSSANLLLVDRRNLKETARKLVKELNLLHRDSVAVRLDEPAGWRDLVELSLLRKTVEAYRPLEAEIRRAASAILAMPDPNSAQLVKAIQELELAIKPLNLTFITELSKRLMDIDKLDRSTV